MKTQLLFIVSGLMVMFFWNCCSDSSPSGPSEPKGPSASFTMSKDTAEVGEMVELTYNGSFETNVSGSFTIIDEENYKVSFDDGSNSDLVNRPCLVRFVIRMVFLNNQSTG